MLSIYPKAAGVASAAHRTSPGSPVGSSRDERGQVRVARTGVVDTAPPCGWPGALARIHSRRHTVKRYWRGARGYDRAVNTRKTLATAWRWLGHVGTATWLWSIGGGAVSSVVLRAFTALSWPWIVLLAVGTACLILAGILTVRQTRPRETTSAERTQGEVGSVGHLTLKPLRANPDVPEELVRAEWNTTCQRVADSTSHPFGRGVVLSLEGTEGEEFDLRCVVSAPDGTRFESTRRIEGFRGAGSSDTRHWPGEFRPKAQEPWAPGYYAYAWIGDKPDILDAESEVLARRFFHIDRDGIITCHRESLAEAPATGDPGGAEGTSFDETPSTAPEQR
jgi:hypothetical protein